MEPQQPPSPKLPEQEAEPTIILPKKPVQPTPTQTPKEPAPTNWFAKDSAPAIQQIAPETLEEVPEPKKSKRWVFILVLILMVVAGAVGVYELVGKPAAKPTPVTVKKTTVTKTTPKQTSASTTKPKSTPLTQTITTELGYIVQLNDLVPNYPAKYPDKNVQTVLVKSTISDNNSQYSGASPTTTSLYLIADDVEYSNSLIVSRHELDEAGYTSMPIGPATKTTPLTGYKAFDIPVGSKKLVFRVKQDQLNVAGTSTVIPAKQYDVAIP